MKILIVDQTAEAQASCASRISSFPQSETESLDLQFQLESPESFLKKIDDVDILMLGSGLGDDAVQIAIKAKNQAPWIHIIMFVSDQVYGGGAFRSAHSAGVRKVFPDSAVSMDVLQELVAIHAEFRRSGRTRDGKMYVVTHAKGGVGATSIAASLAEVASIYQRRTLLWDLDVETRDLSRGLTINGAEAKVVSSWINGTRDLNRDSLTDALIPLSDDVSVLMPPDRMAESMDLVCHTDSIALVQRIVELCRIVSDAIIVDTAGRIGPATGALLRQADAVIVVIDDTVLGLTAVDIYLNYLKSLVSDVSRIKFLLNPYSGALLDENQIIMALESHNLSESAWSLPPVPNDPKGAVWAGSGRTLYGLGSKETRRTIETIAAELGIILPERK